MITAVGRLIIAVQRPLFVPLDKPRQVHDHGPFPAGVGDGVPVAQRLVSGALENDWPLALPHTPLFDEKLAAKLATKLRFEFTE